MLLLSGTADHVLPPTDLAAVEAALEDGGVRHEVVRYPGVGHAFFFTGTPTYDAEAANDAWVRIKAFLSHELRG